MSSKVYFTDFRTTMEENQQEKLARLCLTAGMDQIDFQNKFVAIKIHFGEPGNLAYLRPNYARTVVELVKQLGGKPFLTDCNTLYVGGRKNALEHLDSAYTNGYNPFATDCHILIADGLKGTDDVEVPIPGGQFCKTALIGKAVMDADIVISLSHFKCHENAGIGGAIKNIGMGCGSRAGKCHMHSSSKPQVNRDLCIGCRNCQHICAQDAPTFDDEDTCAIDQNKCVGCGRCIAVCPMDAIEPSYDQSNYELNCRMAEYTKAVLNGRPSFHISLAMDISPCCDCHRENDAPIVPDVGMFASFDPVALDLACTEAVLKQPVNPDSVLGQRYQGSGDYVTLTAPGTEWKSQITHGKKIGLGDDDYQLIRI